MENPLTVSIIGLAVSTIASLYLAAVNRIGDTNALIDKLKKLKLDRFEKNAKAQAGFGNHIIKQVDITSSERNWRGLDEGETDYALEFSKFTVESALYIFKLEKLKKRTDFLNRISDGIIGLSIINVVLALLTLTPELNKTLSIVTPGLSLTIAIFILVTAVVHLFAHRSNSAKIKELDQ